jgi:hypothetical protein
MSQYPGAGYGQPFPPNDGGVSDGAADRPAMLGIIGLALVGIQLIAVLAGTFSSVVTASGPGPGYLLILLAGGLIGLAGWVVGVVATMMFGALLLKSVG